MKHSWILSIIITTLSLIVFWAVFEKRLHPSCVTSSGQFNSTIIENTGNVSRSQSALRDSQRSALEFFQADFSSPKVACARLSSTLRFRRLEDGKVFLISEVLPPVSNEMSRLMSSASSVHGLIDLPKLLMFFLSFHSPSSAEIPGTLGLIGTTPEDPEQIKQEEQIEAILKELDFDVASVNCNTLFINPLELLEQVSIDAQVDVGLLPDGSLVFGHAGKWASSNSPLYQLEFSDKQ